MLCSCGLIAYLNLQRAGQTTPFKTVGGNELVGKGIQHTQHDSADPDPRSFGNSDSSVDVLESEFEDGYLYEYFQDYPVQDSEREDWESSSLLLAYPYDVDNVTCKIQVPTDPLPQVLLKNLNKSVASCRAQDLPKLLPRGVFSTLKENTLTIRTPTEGTRDQFDQRVCFGRVYVYIGNGMSLSEPIIATDAVVKVPGDAEQVVVQCRLTDRQSRYDFFVRVVEKPLYRNRARVLRNMRMQEASERTANQRQSSGSGDDGSPLNILVYLIDSLSRVSFLRNLPETVNALQRLNDTIGAEVYDFMRFNVMGGGTYSNIPPLLAGLAQKNMVKQNANKYPRVTNASSLKLNTLFDWFQNLGFVNGIVEEQCYRNTGSLGRIWNGKQSGDLNARNTYDVIDDGTKMADHELARVFCEVMQFMKAVSFFDSDTHNGACLGERSITEYSHMFAWDFFRRYADLPKFAFVKTSIAHESSAVRTRMIDPMLAKFIKVLHRKYENQVTFLLGDHGLGYGDFATTTHGKYEYNLPMMAMVFSTPVMDKIERALPGARRTLRENSMRLVTAHDLHRTLVMWERGFVWAVIFRVRCNVHVCEHVQKRTNGPVVFHLLARDQACTFHCRYTFRNWSPGLRETLRPWDTKVHTEYPCLRQYPCLGLARKWHA